MGKSGAVCSQENGQACNLHWVSGDLGPSMVAVYQYAISWLLLLAM